MDFDIRDSLKIVKLKLNGDEPKEAIKRALLRTGQKGANLILDRTLAGKDIQDLPFKPYSASYLKFRKRKGKSIRPSLFNKGQMLGAVRTKANTEKATIFFSSAAESKKAAFNQKKRPFFGFSRKDKGELAKFFIRNLKV